MSIHPTAVIDPSALVGSGVSIGAYSIIGPDVVLHDDVEIMSHVVIHKHTTIGRCTRVFPFASLGADPQHAGYNGAPTRLNIGEKNIIRENVTIHRGWSLEERGTLIGSSCMIMVGCHIAHDCHIGDGVILTNQATLAGHVLIENHAILGGLVGVHQFVRIGEGAMLAGCSALGSDIIPYGMALGNRATLEGLNVRKLRRLGTSREEIQAMTELYQWLFHEALEMNLEARIERIPSALLSFPKVEKIVTFITQATQHRPLCMPQT